MSKMADLLIEIEERLQMGYSANQVAEQLDVPIDWVIDTELELMGMHEYGYEND